MVNVFDDRGLSFDAYSHFIWAFIYLVPGIISLYCFATPEQQIVLRSLFLLNL